MLRFRSARALCAGEGQVHSTTEAASAGGNVARKVRKVAAMSTRHGTFSIALWRWPGGSSAPRVVPVRPRVFLKTVAPGDMRAFNVSSCHGLVGQGDRQALVDKELHKCLPLLNPRSSARLSLLTPGVEAWSGTRPPGSRVRLDVERSCLDIFAAQGREVLQSGLQAVRGECIRDFVAVSRIAGARHGAS